MSDEKTQIQRQIKAILGSLLLDLQAVAASQAELSVNRAVDWSNVLNKPPTYAPSEHTHETIHKDIQALSERLVSLQTYIDGLQRTCDFLTAKNKVLSGQVQTQDTNVDQVEQTILQLQNQIDIFKSLKNVVAWHTITGVPTELTNLLVVLEGGLPGQALFRTADGYTWQYVQSFIYQLGTTTPTPTFENPILWGSNDTDVLLWGSGADDTDYLQWG